LRASVPRLVAVLGLQVTILALVPASQVRARLLGRPITLDTGPIDPFSPFAGHYIDLSFRVERPGPGLAPTGLQPGDLVYLNVARSGPAWRLVSVTRALPSPSPERVSLRARWGRYESAEIEGARRFFVPESKARALGEALSVERRRVSDEAEKTRDLAERQRLWDVSAGRVDLRVDEDGHVALVRLRVGDVSADW